VKSAPIIIHSDQKGKEPYSFSDKYGSKTIPLGAAHTNVVYIREYIDPPSVSPSLSYQFKEDINEPTALTFLNGYMDVVLVVSGYQLQGKGVIINGFTLC